MGRKKKNEGKILRVVGEEDAGTEETSPSILHSDVKRSIAALLLFAVGVLFALGFFESAGVIGIFLDRASGRLLGWGKWVFPFILFISGVFLFRRRTSSWSDAVKLGGLGLAFASLLGLFHSFLGGDLGKIASEGGGGGLVGYGLAYAFSVLAGEVGGTVLFLTLFVIGTIAAFNFSLLDISDRLFHRAAPPDLDGSVLPSTQDSTNPESSSRPFSEQLDAKQDLAGDLSQDPVSSPPVLTEDEKLERENIKAIKFADEEEKNSSSSVAKGLPSRPDDLASVPAYFIRPAEVPLPSRRMPKKRNYYWQLPPVDLLDASMEAGFGGDTAARAEVIRDTLANFGIQVIPKEIKEGPTVTQYTFSPASGVKVSRISALQNDLALALAAPSIRIEAPIPGKALLGIEVPNHTSAIVRLRNVFESLAFVKRDREPPLTIALGKDVYGEYRVANLAKMPHLLVAGATNSGKSIFINTLILSLLYQNSPEDLQLVLIDPKRVELSLYNGIPHLVAPVIVEAKKMVSALRQMGGEMERRYKLLEQVGSRDIASYHKRVERGEKREVSLPGGGTREEDLPKLPYIVIVIDEMADLMMAHGREAEGAIVRLAQMSRAVGIHLVLATQRPSVEVITGLIKANIVSRVSFQVATQIDSRTILDQGGAERLLGRGDMLFSTPEYAQPRRLQGALVTEDEVASVVQFLRDQKVTAGYEDPIGENLGDSAFPEKEFALPESNRSGGDLEAAPVGPEPMRPERVSDGMVFSLDDDTENDEDGRDPRYEEARQVVLEFGKASTSFLQRRMGLGYSRAAKLVDLLEADGIIGPADGSKAREVFGTKKPLEESEPSIAEQKE